MKTEILKIKGDWEEVVDDCRGTVGKSGLGKEPSTEFKKSILLSEHSPIRNIDIKWRWANMPHWVTVHWVRHKWEKFVRTQRSDRTGIERGELPQNTPQDFTGSANIQNLIDTWRKRLCCAASPETREYAMDFKATLREVEPEISNVLVPNCVYRCGCPEMKKCSYWENLVEKSNGEIFTFDLQKRYDIYNGLFYESLNKGDV